jgi:N4-gp56 family major capsid protein
MADTTAATGLTVQQWDDKFFVEHVQQNRFAGEMGTSENAIIQVKQDLTQKQGDSVTFALANRLTGAGVENGATLEGNEEDLDSRSFKLTIKERAHGVRVTDWQNQISAIDLRKAGKMSLKTWAMEDTRDRTIAALMSIDGIAFATANATQRNTWLTNNADRVLFGASKSNKKGTHALSLTEIDGTNDKLTASAASLMKRIAQSASPKIRPVMSEKSGREYFTVYVPSLVFRDLKADTTITQAQRDVSLRMQNEKLFKGGDIEWDGMIFKEIHDIPVLTGAGAAGTTDVAPVFFCGAQALGYGIAARWRSAEETFDYGRKKGVAIMEMGGIEKMRFGSGASDLTTPKDHGLVTGWFAAVADA